MIENRENINHPYIHQINEERKAAARNEEIQRMISLHSGRSVVYYDVSTNKVRIWDDEALTSWENAEDHFKKQFLSEESKIRLEQMLRNIHEGLLHGETKIRVREPEKEDRWLDLKYSTLYDGDGKAIAAIITYQDITEHHRHELAYLRQKQAMEQGEKHLGLLEVDITADIIELQSGRMAPPGVRMEGKSLTAFAKQMVEMKFMEEDKAEGIVFFSPSFLLQQYGNGFHALERTWKMVFRGGSIGWVRVSVELILEPYTGHIKAFIKLTDITIEKETQMMVKLRAEQDGMTGLLNRATLENKVRACLEIDQRPGIMILVDMDDLKRVNDVYGHIEGDKAIRGIAQALKTHFRESDLIGRLGGDEFLIYLRGAGENISAISATLTALLRRLAIIPIGEGENQGVHCSLGCAVQEPDANDFETLYRRADIALYHVKRDNKNGFAFYDKAMEEEDYQFKMGKMLSVSQNQKEKIPEGQRLLDAVLDYYGLVMSMNLSSNSYYLVAEVQEGVFSQLPQFGAFDDFFLLANKGIHPEDAAVFREHLSRDGLIQAYRQGKKNMHTRFRFLERGGHRFVECTVILYQNECGDICDFTLLRWSDENPNM